MNQREEAKAAKKFAEKWKDKGKEEQDTSKFWIELLEEVFGVKKATNYCEFQKSIKIRNKTTNRKVTKKIDVMIPSTKTLIEQKSIDVDLTVPHKQSDEEMLTAFEQAKRYADNLRHENKPRWIVTCNFAEFRVYDLNQELPEDKPQVIELAKLPKEYHRLKFLVDEKHDRIEREEQISRDAGDIVQRIYDEILPAYNTKDEAELHSLNKLCVRLVFLFYAEDAGLFEKKNQFCDYMKDVQPCDFRDKLLKLFCILDTPRDERDQYEKHDLLEFPYVNGGLFSKKEEIVIPQISEKAVKVIIKDGGCFDWSQISPTIFGAIFESTLNPETRRKRGMHYTSPENIHKVIDPLFLDGYRKKFDEAMKEKNSKERKKKLFALQDDLARAKFFDPAAGSGNFLTESYISIRHLENDIVRELYNIKEKGGLLGFEELNPIKVSISQFYGIEIHDFAVSVAKTAIWIAESQCIKETEDIIKREINFLPLKTEANIHEGNALRMDWREILSPSDEVYLMGNPPFVGARIMAAGSVQKTDMAHVFAGWKNFGNLDYVSAWYKKAADYMVGTQVCAAFVSTNSITQGDSVATLWKPLFEQGIKIFFAHRTFKWNSESKDKAAVHCVIVGFGQRKQTPCTLYTDGQGEEVAQINPYLVAAPTVFIESRTKPLCDVPKMTMGNSAVDGGNLIIEADEYEDFINKEPNAKKWIKPYMMGYEFLNNKKRYCLWLVDCPPQELRAMPLVMKRVEKVREFRLASHRVNTHKAANEPTLFAEVRNCKRDYIAIPIVSSESRRYIPIGYLSKEIIAGIKLFMLPDATLYHFGILQSNVHMAWVRTTAGRLKSDYSYSNTLVYNNFPFPEPTDDQRAAIEKTAQAILDARKPYSESSLADLYDVNTMPKELREAHHANDRAVMKCYGLPRNTPEDKIVALLMKRYEALTEKK